MPVVYVFHVGMPDILYTPWCLAYFPWCYDACIHSMSYCHTCIQCHEVTHTYIATMLDIHPMSFMLQWQTYIPQHNVGHAVCDIMWDIHSMLCIHSVMYILPKHCLMPYFFCVCWFPHAVMSVDVVEVRASLVGQTWTSCYESILMNNILIINNTSFLFFLLFFCPYVSHKMLVELLSVETFLLVLQIAWFCQSLYSVPEVPSCLLVFTILKCSSSVAQIFSLSISLHTAVM